jgi:tetratricopeptide (TPR) repeat protein
MEQRIMNGNLSDFFKKYSYLIIILLALISYVQVVSFGYVRFDDDMQILSKIEILSDINNLQEAFLTDSFFTKGGYYYRPMMNATFLLDTQISGISPWMHHATSLLLHIFTALALFTLLKKLKYDVIPSLFWASVFAVSPVYSNAVAWLPARNDLLMGFFGMIAFINYLKFEESGKIHHFLIHVLSIMAAFMSKEIAFLFTLVFTFHTFLFNKQNLFSKRNFMLYGAWVLLLLIWLYLRSFSMGDGTTRFDPMGINQFLLNLPFIPEIVAKFFLPFMVTTMPTYTPQVYIPGLIIMAAIAYFAYRKKDKRIKYLLLGTAIFFLFATPGLIFRYPTAKDYFEYFEARAYLPLMGLIIVLIELVPKKFYDLSNRVSQISIAAILIALIAINYWKLPNYRDALPFWKAAVVHRPDRSLFNFHLGRNLLREGKDDIAEKFFLKALKINPNIPEANYETGLYYFQKGLYERAIPYFKKLIEKEKKYLRVLELRFFVQNSYKIIAASYFYLGNNDAAIDYYRRSFSKWPKDTQVIENLIKVYIAAKRFEDALGLANYYKSIGTPYNIYAEIYNEWGLTLRKQGRIAEAIQKIDDGLAMNPNNPKMLINKGRLLSEINRIGDAVNYWLKAVEIDSKNIDAYKLLLNYYQKIGNTQKVNEYKAIIDRLSGKPQ